MTHADWKNVEGHLWHIEYWFNMMTDKDEGEMGRNAAKENLRRQIVGFKICVEHLPHDAEIPVEKKTVHVNPYYPEVEGAIIRRGD